mmetsp:Transcript_45182/g.141582  ORF Transcript_45182/g.141582 Transcript_45182/m.141582 type:complete len:114 (-) Transcript_45182:206-547(-)
MREVARRKGIADLSRIKVMDLPSEEDLSLSDRPRKAAERLGAPTDYAWHPLLVTLWQSTTKKQWEAELEAKEREAERQRRLRLGDFPGDADPASIALDVSKGRFLITFMRHAR